VTVTAPDAVLSVRGLTKHFGALQVAQDIDLDLAQGARVGLIGPNGAGKTTLINLLTGVLRANAGSIALAGQPIDRLGAAARVRAGIVRTHQINTLLNQTTARENLAIAIAERDDIAWRMLRFSRAWQACLAEADERLGEIGIADVADRIVAELPYGQQRLLEIAIALSLRPRVLLLDEPAAGVPSIEAHAIHAVIDRLPDNVAVLMIEHDMDLVFRFAREVVVLVRGRVLTRGTPAEIASNAEVRSVYLGRSAA
jgi:branched-chain amino acid transport system ATP-binding protein